MNKKDTGIDIIDVENKIFYQCKNYSKPLSLKDIDGFLQMKERFTKQFNDEFKWVLISNIEMNKKAKLPSDIEFIKINNDDLDNWWNNFISKKN